MTFDQLVYSDFVSIRTFKIFTDSEFWQNSRSFADNIMSPTFEVSWGRKDKVRNVLLLTFLGAGHLQPMIIRLSTWFSEAVWAQYGLNMASIWIQYCINVILQLHLSSWGRWGHEVIDLNLLKFAKICWAWAKLTWLRKKIITILLGKLRN